MPPAKFHHFALLAISFCILGCENANQPSEVRFFAIGDGGTGRLEQFNVAAAVASKCAADECDFGLYLGDVIYDIGVTSPSDPQFQTKFEQPYAPIGVPIYISLGNHDYGAEGRGTEYEKGAYYVAYALGSDIWTMPAEYYNFDWGPVTFLALGTQLIVRDHDGAVAIQGALFSDAMAASYRPWKIAFGHHPYLSNGDHGNTGGNLGVFFETYLCGQADLFLAGHDHDLQVLPGTAECPGTFVVSGGGGAGVRPLTGTQPTHFQVSDYGFAYFRVTADTIFLEMITVDGQVAHSMEITIP